MFVFILLYHQNYSLTHYGHCQCYVHFIQNPLGLLFFPWLMFLSDVYLVPLKPTAVHLIRLLSYKLLTAREAALINDLITC